MSTTQHHAYDLTDVVPSEQLPFSASFDVDGDMSMNCTRLARTGDLLRADLDLRTGESDMQLSVLGGDQYFVDWGAYHFRRGLRLEARTDQPALQLSFQLAGSTHSVRTPFGLDFALRAGETNLVFVPSIDGRFEVASDLRGDMFEVLLSHAYFSSLAERYPQLLGDVLERTLREQPFWLSRHHLRITPAMLSVIERIRRCEADHAAGSLFLEAQVLELIALQFEQLGTQTTDGHDLSAADVDRIHHAREVLLAHLTNPPTLAELARAVGTNEHTLNRGFNAVFGSSPYAYMLEHRMERARSYVVDTDLTIAEIAFRMGYSDPAHLTNAFRKQYGHPPSTLR